MLVTGFLLIILSLGGITVFTWDENESKNRAMVFGLTVAIPLYLGIVMALFFAFRNEPKKIFLKDNALNIEVRQNVINGKIESSDTVYIFTPKKK